MSICRACYEFPQSDFSILVICRKPPRRKLRPLVTFLPRSVAFLNASADSGIKGPHRYKFVALSAEPESERKWI